MNWLITGGCGFIGTNLVGALANQGEHRMRVVDDLSGGSLAALESVAAVKPVDPDDLPTWHEEPVQWVRADVREPEVALRTAAGADVIVHLAANTGVQPSIADPRRDCEINVLGTLNYLEAARVQRVARFVFASSGGTVIGDSEPPIREDMVARPKAPYGASKSAGEGYLSAYFGSYGIDTVALRFSNVYGPRSTHKSSVVARFLREALAGETLTIFGDGHQTRDYIFVEDLVRAIVAAATTDGIGGEVFQVATGRETSVDRLFRIIQRVFEEAGLESPAVAHADALPGEIRRNYSDTSKIRARLAWTATTSLEDGLARTLDWFRAHSGA